MSLDYGFGRWESDPIKSRKWTTLFKSLSKFDKEFFHGRLAWWCMATDIGTITPVSIPHLISRMQIVDREGLHEIGKLMRAEYGDDMTIEVWLERFVGFQTNVLTLSTAKWLTKRAQIMRRCVPSGSPDMLSKEYRALCDKRIEDVEPAEEIKEAA